MNKMKSDINVLIAIMALVVASAHAEMLMYHGVPGTGALGKHPEFKTSVFRGFTAEVESRGDFAPSASSYATIEGYTAGVTLKNPDCFAESGDIPPVPLNSTNSSVIASSPSLTGTGAKVMTLLENGQSKTGSLFFKMLIYADQDVLDAMTADTASAPTLHVSESCGVIWSVDDYFHEWKQNDELRYITGYEIAHSGRNPKLDDGSNRPKIAFSRGFMIGLHKDVCGVPEIRLYAWGKASSDYESGVKSIPLAYGIVGGKTYVCTVRIDIGKYDNGEERLSGLAQTAEEYDRYADWAAVPFHQSIRTEMIGAADAKDLVAQLTVQTKGFGGAGYLRFDEIGFATEKSDLVVWNPPAEDYSSVLAYDGFPCGDHGYSTEARRINSKDGQNKDVSPATNAVFGFSEPWLMYIDKSTTVYVGEGNGLAFPSPYAAQGIVPFPGTAMGFSSTGTQALYAKRTLSDGLLALTKGDMLNFRCLLSVTDKTIAALSNPPEKPGYLTTGAVGTKSNVNYVGCGIADCVQLETGDSQAPCLCRRGNACFFTVTKNSDGTSAVYLNLLEQQDGEQIPVKILDVDPAVGGTFLCYAQIEVGAGANGKERIRAFACDVSKVTTQEVKTWVPASKADPAIECELISDSSYPKHAMIGGQVANGFRADEVALSIGRDPYPLVWAKYPPTGLVLIFR